MSDYRMTAAQLEAIQGTNRALYDAMLQAQVQMSMQGQILADILTQPIDGPTVAPEPPVEPPVQPPVSGDSGWTEFPAVQDERIVYVSSDFDDNSRKDGSIHYVRTIAEGVRRLRDGYPDHLCLARGETFTHSFGNWQKSGRSKTDRMVIRDSGDMSKPRPVIVTPDNESCISIIKNDRRAHVAFVGLEIRPYTKYRKAAISVNSGGVEDFWFEDLLVSGFTHGFTFEGAPKDITVRRCIVDDMSGMTHAQGLYATGVDGLTIEENYFGYCGWHGDRDRRAGIFAHAIYTQPSVTRQIIFDNAILEPASHGIQVRNGGFVDGNVIVRAPIGILFGNERLKDHEKAAAVTGTCDGNYIFDSIDINSSLRRKWGIHFMGVNEVDAIGNVIARGFERGAGRAIILSDDKPAVNRGLRIAELTIAGHDEPFRIGTHDNENVRIEESVVEARDGDISLASGFGVTFEDNDIVRDAKVPPFSAWLAAHGFATADDWRAALLQQRRGNWNEALHAPAIRAWFAARTGVGA